MKKHTNDGVSSFALSVEDFENMIQGFSVPKKSKELFDKVIPSQKDSMITTDKRSLIETQMAKQVIVDMLSLTNSLSIDSEESKEKILSIYSQAKDWEEVVEGYKKELCAPYKEKITEISDKAKQLTSVLKDITSICNSKVSKYRDSLIANQKEVAEMLDINVLDMPKQEIKGSKAGTSIRKEKKYRVINLDLVPREYLCLDEKKVELLVKAGMDIPGIEVYEEEKVILRRK